MRWCTGLRRHRPVAIWRPSYILLTAYPRICLSLQSSFRRGAKTSSKVTLDDIPQGQLDPGPEDLLADDVPTYPTVIQQHLNNVSRFKGCVVLTRVGNFYEMYGDQAEKFGPLLGLKVAARKTGLGAVPMSGFQIFQIDRYLKQLVQDLNTSVAIAEEHRHSAADQVKAGGLLYDRKVSRVITAGTLIDENFVNPLENNYLLAISGNQDVTVGAKAGGPSLGSDVIGVSWVDLSSGDFYTQHTTRDALSSVITRVAPREVLLATDLEGIQSAQLRSVLEGGHFTLSHHTSTCTFDDPARWNSLLDRPFDSEAATMSREEVLAASLLLDYVQDKLQKLKITLRPPVQTNDLVMTIDKHSLRGLEIRSTLRDGNLQGSLLHAVRRTVTKSGTRALLSRLLLPSMSLTIIDERLDLVEEFIAHEELRETTRSLLERTFDVPRLLQKFSIGRGDADDLLAVARTIDAVASLFHHLREHDNAQKSTRLAPIISTMRDLDFEKLSKIARLIQSSIDEEGLSRQQTAEQEDVEAISEYAEKIAENEGPSRRPRKPSSKESIKDIEISEDIWIMRRSATPTLASVHDELDHKFEQKSELVADLRDQMKANSLSLKWTAQSKYFCHVKGKDRAMVIPGAHTISSSKTTRSFVLPQWSALGAQIDQVRARIRAEEARIFASLRDNVISQLVRLRRCSSLLDELDIACSSATLADEQNLVRPILHSGIEHHVVGGRHPMVDAGLLKSGRSFTANDCVLNENERILLITGPNMAGKSTYLRQNALISIMAQTGLYVPADYARIGLVDQVFSRVGSADDLYNHQSTFMVEMVEVAEILNQATKRSFVIMDEVGRGTTPEDGVAVGYACLKYLHDTIGCRTLFATHFHSLSTMTRDMASLTRWCTDVEETGDGGWVYVHKMRRGTNTRSHALKVAALAGLPQEAIRIAGSVLERISSGSEGAQHGVAEDASDCASRSE